MYIFSFIIFCIYFGRSGSNKNQVDYRLPHVLTLGLSYGVENVTMLETFQFSTSNKKFIRLPGVAVAHKSKTLPYEIQVTARVFTYIFIILYLTSDLIYAYIYVYIVFVSIKTFIYIYIYCTLGCGALELKSETFSKTAIYNRLDFTFAIENPRFLSKHKKRFNLHEIFKGR